eukprot:8199175-Karenia_brevis.AAC.1
MGFGTHRHRIWYIMFGILLRLGFYALLRPKETVMLRASDVTIHLSLEQAPVAVIVVRAPKNKFSMGFSQFALVKDSGTIKWLVWALKYLPPETKLWPSTQPQFAKIFSEVASRAGISGLHLTPASMRAGGTTYRFLQGESPEQLMFAGRWASHQSLKCYIQEA